MAELFAYTDGACSGNPGPGGWGVVLEAWEGETLVKSRDLGDGEVRRPREAGRIDGGPILREGAAQGVQDLPPVVEVEQRLPSGPIRRAKLRSDGSKRP